MSAMALSRVVAGPARSENPGTHGNLHAREPGGPAVTRGVDGCPVRDGSRGGGSALGGSRGER